MPPFITNMRSLDERRLKYNERSSWCITEQVCEIMQYLPMVQNMKILKTSTKVRWPRRTVIHRVVPFSRLISSICSPKNFILNLLVVVVCIIFRDPSISIVYRVLWETWRRKKGFIFSMFKVGVLYSSSFSHINV